MSTILLVVISIPILIFLITKFNLNAFLAIILVALGLALAAGNTGVESINLVLDGFSATMRSSAIIIVLGVIIGAILEKTGGAQKIAQSVLNRVGEKHSLLAMCITGSIVSIPVFSDSAFMILHPIIKNVSKRAKVSYMAIVLGSIMCMALTHSTVPPTPGPIAAAAILGADLGKVIAGGLFIAVPATLAIYFYASKVIAKQYPAPATDDADDADFASTGSEFFKKNILNPKGCTTFGAYLPIVLPIALIVCQSVFSAILPADSSVVALFSFIGNPMIALLIGVGVVWIVTNDYENNVRMQWVEKAMDSTALVLLITSAGGAFGAVIRSTGIGDILSQSMGDLGVPSVLLPWLISVALLTATGSTTVALTTASAVCVTFIDSLGISPELCVLAIAAGGMSVLHVNCSLFWMIQRLCKFEVKDTLKTLAPLSAVCSISALASTLVLSLFM